MINVSMLPAYEYCKRKIFLTNVLGFREPRKQATSLGTIRHQTHGEINKADEGIVTSIRESISKEEIVARYKKKYREILTEIISQHKSALQELNLDLRGVFKSVWPLILEESETRASRVHEFMEMNDVYGEELWLQLTPKIESEIRMESEKLNLKGYVDQIETYKGGIVPIELKTGSCPKEGVWPGHEQQIAAYAMLAEEHFNQPVHEGFVHYLDQNERRHIPINPFIRDKITSRVNDIVLLLSSSDLPERVTNTNKCTNCGLREQCYNDQLMQEKVKNLKTKSLNTI